MSGKPWPPKRRRAHAARMRERWSDHDYRSRQSASRKVAAADPDFRAEKSRLMIELNDRMKSDPSLKAANLAGLHRSYLDGDRGARLSARMTETMTRGDLRARAAAHCRALGSADNTRRGWKTRRMNALRRKVERRPNV